jgi:FlaG/FlaF family flagellin (archaellin)
MVAITVILAAVIAAFVLGLGDTSNPAPQVSFDYDYDSDNTELTITVSSGDRVDAERISFEGTGINDADWIGSGGDDTVLSAGDSTDVDVAGDDFELDVVFTSEDGQDSSIISTRTGPAAN